MMLCSEYLSSNYQSLCSVLGLQMGNYSNSGHAFMKTWQPTLTSKFWHWKAKISSSIHALFAKRVWTKYWAVFFFLTPGPYYSKDARSLVIRADATANSSSEKRTNPLHQFIGVNVQYYLVANFKWMCSFQVLFMWIDCLLSKMLQVLKCSAESSFWRQALYQFLVFAL